MSLSESVKTLVTDFLAQEPQGLLVVLGPTASGKTGFSVELAQWVNSLSQALPAGRKKHEVEIISVDSRQIYRDCNISAAKITPEEMQGVVHHGIDLVDLNQEYSVYDWQQYCFNTIDEIQARGNIPLLCGGTMLWLDAVTENYEFSTEYRNIGTSEKLNNKEFLKSNKKAPPRWSCLKLGLQWPREVLYERINQRAVQQFEGGLIEETVAIIKKYGTPKSKIQNPKSEIISSKVITKNAFTSFGYKEIKAYLDGELTYDEALSLNQQRNRNYAKRQLTWWRGREDIVWL